MVAFLALSASDSEKQREKRNRQKGGKMTSAGLHWSNDK